MDVPPRKIEVFAPFSAALDLTKLILFQPFDIGKWCVIGFAAFLAQLGGGGGSFNPGRKLWHKDNFDWKFSSFSQDAGESTFAWPSWLLPLLIVGGLLMLALIVVLLWVRSRGRFVFTDCIVRNRGAIVEPWREFRKEGNSFFVFSLLVTLGMLALVTVVGLPVWVPLLRHSESVGGPAFIVAAIVLAVVFICVGVAIGLICNFMVPVMYRRRCSAVDGLRGAVALILAEPGPVILYVLFTCVLWLGFIMIACVSTCVTCCITALPYVGTVMLLPAYVFFASYLLLFLRQFGPDYDVWANLAPAPPPPTLTIDAVPPPPPPEVPPLQT